MSKTIINEIDQLTEAEVKELINRLKNNIKDETDQFKMVYALMKSNQLEAAYDYLEKIVSGKMVEFSNVLKSDYYVQQDPWTKSWEITEIGPKPPKRDDDCCCICCSCACEIVGCAVCMTGGCQTDLIIHDCCGFICESLQNCCDLIFDD